MPKQFTIPQAMSDRPRPPIALEPLPRESQQIKARGYDAATRTLALRFTPGPGPIYHYPNVEPATFEAFCAAESAGSFFGQHIKHLPFEKYPPEVDAAPAGGEKAEA